MTYSGNGSSLSCVSNTISLTVPWAPFISPASTHMLEVTITRAPIVIWIVDFRPLKFSADVSGFPLFPVSRACILRILLFDSFAKLISFSALHFPACLFVVTSLVPYISRCICSSKGKTLKSLFSKIS